MGTINPSLFAMLGQGFSSDAYARDGNHLRWMFDPRLGFPRFAFCVELRPSVTTEAGRRRLPIQRADLRLPAGSPAQTSAVLSLPNVSAKRMGGTVTRSTLGVALAAQPLRLRFLGSEPYACWVRLRLALRSPGGKVRAEALYINRGEAEVVDVATRSLVRRPFPPVTGTALSDQLAALLERPDIGRLVASPPDPRLRLLMQRLTAAQPGRFARATPAWLGRVQALLDQLGLRPDQIGTDLSFPVTIELLLDAARIDELSITGDLGDITDLSWVRSEDLMADGEWKPFGCFPAATEETDYVRRNAPLLGGVDIAALAKDRVMGGAGNGAEPLDDPQVPPSRPPKPEELEARYLEPWLQRLQPWLKQFLDGSLGGQRHQSEIEIPVDLQDAGQRRGEVPRRLADRTRRMTFRPYPLLLVAAAGFPTARLLGLGCIDTKPAETAMDYRVRGRWLVEDLWAVAQCLQRKFAVLADRVAQASPFELPGLQGELLAAQAELSATTSFIGNLVIGAAGGAVTIWGLKVGVVPAVRPLFQAPGGLTIASAGRGLPPDHAAEAVAAVTWQLRQRARATVAETIPLGACIARAFAPSAGVFESVRNAADPGATRPVPLAFLPGNPDPLLDATATYNDRYVDDGVRYRYGVSECDPFGRWSPFAETTFQWDDLTPPAPPVEVTAELDEIGTPPAMTLTVRFTWPVERIPNTSFGYEIHLRRDAPPSAAPVARAAWGRCERVAGDGATPFVFDASFAGATSHDGMPVIITQEDAFHQGLGGTAERHRAYRVTFSGLVLPHDATDRALAWTAVGSRNAKGIASAELGGPGRAEHFRILPPPPPIFPPEPQLASFPDAERQSSFVLSWSATPNQRSVVYRAGEHDVVALARARGVPVTWNEADPPALRSAAARAVAPLLRDAFRPLCELLPAGTGNFTDTLGGGLRTLSLYTVVGHSAALVPGAWPASADGFVAVAVPQIPEPSRPVLIRAVWSSAGGGSVQIEIAEPGRGQGPIESIELYRVPETDAERARDWRRMRPVGHFPLIAGDFADRPAGPPRVAIIADDTISPWRAYLYRAVARAPGADGASGTRSAPSAVLRAVTLSPDPPTPPDTVVAALNGGDLVLSWRAAAPVSGAGPFRFEIVQVTPGPRSILATRGADALREVADASAFRLTLLILADPAPTSIQVVVIDPLGRRMSGDIVDVEPS